MIVSLFIQGTLKHTYLVTSGQYSFFFFVLAMFFRQNLSYFFIAKRVKFSVPALPKELMQPCPQGLSVPSLFPAIARTTDVIFPDIAKVFHIWSTQAGYEELAEQFEPIRNGDKLF